jgi:hypothetical protein
VFLDEAGNTGTNHTDDTQPYYVLAGWIVEDDDVASARDVARVALRPAQTGQTEVKGSELCKTMKGRERLANLLGSLGKAGALPFFVAIHKRYSLAGRFVEYFLDSAYNPQVWPEWFADRDTKRRFAGEIAALPDLITDQIQQVFRLGSISDAEACATAIRDALRTNGNASLAQKVEGILGRTKGPVDELSSVDGPKSKGTTPNFAAFATALQSLGSQAKERGFELTFVHDETSSFEATFTECYETLRSLDPKSVLGQAIESLAPGAVPLSSVAALKFERSVNEPLVQAADVLAAATAWLFRGNIPVDQEPGEPAVATMAMTTLGTLLQDEPRFWHFVASDDEIGKIQLRLRRLAQPALELDGT